MFRYLLPIGIMLCTVFAATVEIGVMEAGQDSPFEC